MLPISQASPALRSASRLAQSVAAILLAFVVAAPSLFADELEKTDLRIGFIKLTDCAPIVIAAEKGFFASQGLRVEVVAQANWRTLQDNVVSGDLDAAHMLAGQPIAATIGIGNQVHLVTPFSLDLNGNAITVSNAVWARMQEEDLDLDSPTPPHPISAAALRPVVDDYLMQGRKLQMGVVFPVSTHNYELRYWLAAAGIHPGIYTDSDVGGRTNAEVEISVTPPPMMPRTMEAGNIQGYCVGEPWNQQALEMGIGVPVVTNYDIWRNNPEKVLGMTAEWAEAHPNTVRAVVRALLLACQWLDAMDESGAYINRDEAARILARSEYVGAPYNVIRNSMTGYFYFQRTDRREMPDFNVFFRHHANFPFYSDGIWFLTQMRRWGQISTPQTDEWYHQTIQRIYRPDIFLAAARELADQGLIQESDIPWDSDGYRPPTNEFIDGRTYDGRDPLGYLAGFSIGHTR